MTLMEASSPQAENSRDPEAPARVQAALDELEIQAQNRDPMIALLAKQGIFIWLDGINLGVHSKQEHGRTYNALLHRTHLKDGGRQTVFSWESGEVAWIKELKPEEEPPEELLTMLSGITTIEEEERVHHQRINSWHPTNKTSDPAYRSAY